MDADESDINEKDTYTGNYVTTPYGFQSNGIYSHASKRCEIQAVTFNTKTNECIIVDSRGVTSWVKNIIRNTTHRLLEFEAYKNNVLRDIIYCRAHNVYFALSKEYELKVFNSIFNEIYSHESDGDSISSLLFNERCKELISVGRNHVRFWKYSLMNTNGRLQGLLLQREFPTPVSSLVTNAILDDEHQRIYLLCDHDICCYDLEGRCIFHLKNTSTMYLSVCAFSSDANVMIIGSINGQIKIYSTSGGLVTTLLNHSRVITSIIIHPSDGSMFISSSMDGTIKLFSLHMFEELYSINVFRDGVYWMKLRSHTVLYCASRKSIQLFDLNYTFKFWSTVRCPIKSLKLTPKKKQKTSHIVACNTDYSIRLYSKRTGKKKCTVLPPPEMSVLDEVLSMAYDRVGNIIYLLFKYADLWIYSVRTDPATRVAMWSIPEIIENHLNRATGDPDISTESVERIFGESSFNLNRADSNIQCNCMSTLSQNIGFKNKPNNDNMTTQNFSFLLCGMSNGSVYYLDPAIEGYVSSSFKAHDTSPVIELDVFYYSYVTQISTLIKTIDGLLLRIWDAEDLTLLQEFSIPENYTTICSKVLFSAVGCSNGFLRIKRHTKVNSSESPPSFNNIPTGLVYSKDHSGAVLSVDILEEKEIICSCGVDEYVRIWNCEKILLQEIKFDKSLCCSIFMDKVGTILLGFKSHLFVIPYSLLELPNNIIDESSDSWDNESYVYEDPYVKREFKRPIITKTTLQNYLIPYPHLDMDSLWMFQNTLTYDTDDDDNQDADIESIAGSLQNSEIYADTEIYQDTEYSDDSRANSQLFEFPQCGIISSSDESINETPVVYHPETVINTVEDQSISKKESLDKENVRASYKIPSLTERIQNLQLKPTLTKQNLKKNETVSPDKLKDHNGYLNSLRKMKIKKKSKQRKNVSTVKKEQEESKIKVDAKSEGLKKENMLPKSGTSGKDEECLQKEANTIEKLQMLESSDARRSLMSPSHEHNKISLKTSSSSSTVVADQLVSKVQIVPKKVNVQLKRRSVSKNNNLRKASDLKQLTAISLGQFDKSLSSSFHSVMGSLLGKKGKSRADIDREYSNISKDDIHGEKNRRIEKTDLPKNKFAKKEKMKQYSNRKTPNSIQSYVVTKKKSLSEANDIKRPSKKSSDLIKTESSTSIKTSNPIPIQMKSKVVQKNNASKTSRSLDKRHSIIIDNNIKNEPMSEGRSDDVSEDPIVGSKSENSEPISEGQSDEVLEVPIVVFKSKNSEPISEDPSDDVLDSIIRTASSKHKRIDHYSHSTQVDKRKKSVSTHSKAIFMFSKIRRISQSRMSQIYDENMNKTISLVGNANDGKPIITEEINISTEKAAIIMEEIKISTEETPIITEEINIPTEKTPTITEEINIPTEKTAIIMEEINIPAEKTPTITEEINIPTEKTHQDDQTVQLNVVNPSEPINEVKINTNNELEIFTSSSTTDLENPIAEVKSSESKNVMKFIVSAFVKKKPTIREISSTVDRIERPTHMKQSSNEESNYAQESTLEYADFDQESPNVDTIADYNSNNHLSIDVQCRHNSPYSDEEEFLTPRNSVASFHYASHITNIDVHNVDYILNNFETENRLVRSNSVLLEKLTRKRHNQAKHKLRCESVQMRRNQSVNSMESYSDQKRYYGVDSNKERLSIKNFFASASDLPGSSENYRSTPMPKQEMNRLEKVKKLEQKLSGQPHRFHLAKSPEEIEANRVALLYLKSREKGLNILPVEKSSVSIPSKFTWRIVDKMSENRMSSNILVPKRVLLKNS